MVQAVAVAEIPTSSYQPEICKLQVSKGTGICSRASTKTDQATISVSQSSQLFFAFLSPVNERQLEIFGLKKRSDEHQPVHRAETGEIAVRDWLCEEGEKGLISPTARAAVVTAKTFRP